VKATKGMILSFLYNFSHIEDTVCVQAGDFGGDRRASVFTAEINRKYSNKVSASAPLPLQSNNSIPSNKCKRKKQGLPYGTVTTPNPIDIFRCSLKAICTFSFSDLHSPRENMGGKSVTNHFQILHNHAINAKWSHTWTITEWPLLCKWSTVCTPQYSNRRQLMTSPPSYWPCISTMVHDSYCNVWWRFVRCINEHIIANNRKYLSLDREDLSAWMFHIFYGSRDGWTNRTTMQVAQ
jgi:hypothetical protein